LLTECNDQRTLRNPGEQLRIELAELAKGIPCYLQLPLHGGLAKLIFEIGFQRPVREEARYALQGAQRQLEVDIRLLAHTPAPGCARWTA
jgi:hypothetical protein